GWRDPRPRADPESARTAEGDQGNARRGLSRGAVLPRPDRRTLRRDKRGRLQGVPAEVRAQSAVSAHDHNQPPPFEGRNLYSGDLALQRAVAREGAAWAHDRLAAWGETLGRSETFALAVRANRYAPELRTHDRSGKRIDEVAFDPAWHELMRLAMREGEHCAPWAEPRAGAQ